MGGIFASEIWRAYFREGLLSEFYGISWEKFMNIFIVCFLFLFVFCFLFFCLAGAEYRKVFKCIILNELLSTSIQQDFC